MKAAIVALALLATSPALACDGVEYDGTCYSCSQIRFWNRILPKATIKSYVRKSTAAQRAAGRRCLRG